MLDESAGLEDYLAYAAFNNPGLEAAFNRWKAAVERVPQVRALPDPRFTYVYYIEAVDQAGMGSSFPDWTKTAPCVFVATEAP